MLKGLFNPNKNHRQADFWAWFQENEGKIWNIDKNREKVVDMLSEAIHLVDPGLTFEIGAVDEYGKREFVLSADGISSNIPKVESLFLSAPELARWRVIKYRPRSSIANAQIEMGGKKISAGDIRFQVFNDGEKIGILLLFESYSAERRNQFAAFGFLFLDRALGEYDVMTRVGFVDFAGRESNLFADARRLPELPGMFDDYFKAR